MREFTQTSGDSVYSLRLLRTGGMRGGDSIYYFNSRVGLNVWSNGSVCQNYRYADNLFGGRMEISGQGTSRVSYTLVYGDYLNSNYAATLTLQPRAPLNQPLPWGDEVIARSVQPVFGQLDSVVTIRLADGGRVRLSKNFGLLEAPAVRDYAFQHNTRYRVRQLALTALPNRQLGRAQLTAHAIYDFQPGDTFWYQTYDTMCGMQGLTPTSTYADSVMTRTASRTGDTLTYRIWRCQAGQSGSAYTLHVSARQSNLHYGTGECVRVPRAGSSSPAEIGVMQDAVLGYRWPTRMTRLYTGRYWWTGTDSLCLQRPNPDIIRRIGYAAGLGQTNYSEINLWPCLLGTDLIGYRKGTETWGVTTPFACRPILPTAAVRPAATTAAFPNPFADELTVRFELIKAQPVALELRDALGRTVLTKAAAPVAAGTQQLALPTAALPGGVYTLHLRFADDGHREVLKVVKAE